MKIHHFSFKVIDNSRSFWFFRPMTLPLIKAADTTGTTKFVDDYLLYQLASASQFLSAEFHQDVKSSGLKVHTWRVLACLVDQPGLMLTALSKLVLYEQSRLTKIIDQMVDDGLVAKSPVAGDRRKIAIFITTKGQNIVDPLLIKAKVHEKKVLELLTESEQATLKHTLRKLNRQQDQPSPRLLPIVINADAGEL